MANKKKYSTLEKEIEQLKNENEALKFNLRVIEGVNKFMTPIIKKSTNQKKFMKEFTKALKPTKQMFEYVKQRREERAKTQTMG